MQVHHIPQQRQEDEQQEYRDSGCDCQFAVESAPDSKTYEENTVDFTDDADKKRHPVIRAFREINGDPVLNAPS